MNDKEITFDDLLKAYNEDPDFRRYVNRCMKTYGKNFYFTLRQPIILNYYKYLNKIGEYQND